MNTNPLTLARRRDSQRRRQKVIDAITTLSASGADLTVSAVARAAGVHRSLIHRHPDLHTAILTHASESSITGPAASQRSLQVDLVNVTEQLRRRDAHIRALEQRLARSLGQDVWATSGLGAPPDTDQLNQTITHLEQQVVELRRQLADCQDELDAARATNRQLITQLNTKRE